MTSFDRLELAKGFGGRKTAIADTAHTRNYAGNLSREFASTFHAMRYKNAKDANAIKSHITRRISRRETQRALYAKAVKHKTLIKKLGRVKPLAIAAVGGIAIKHLADKRMSLSLSATGLIKHASSGLKNRTVRDYLKMRFSKAAPAAGRIASNVGGAAKGLASNMHVQGIAGGIVAHKATKRKSDTEVEAHKRAGAASGGAYFTAVGGHMGVNSLKLRSRANDIAHTATANRVRSIGNTMGGLAVGAGIVGAARLHQSFRKNAAERKAVKASFDPMMVLSHDAELRLDRAFANRQASIGNRVDNAHATASQRGNQATNAIGGAAALGAGSKLMHKAPITAAVRATLKGGGIKSAAMKLGMRSRGIAGVAAVGTGLHLLNKARKPIAASFEPLECAMGNSMMGTPASKPRSIIKSTAMGAIGGGLVTGHPLGAAAGAVGGVGANLARRLIKKVRGAPPIKASHDTLELGSRITPLPNKFGGIKKTMPYTTMPSAAKPVSTAIHSAAKPASVSSARMGSAVAKLKSVNKIHLLKSQLARRTVTAGVTGAVGGAGVVGAGLLAHHLLKKIRSTKA